MRKINEILEKTITELVNQKNRFEHMVIRTVPGEDFYFAKLSGGKEYSLKYSLVLVNGTILEAKEITKEEYYKY
jgi:hypothetical protein